MRAGARAVLAHRPALPVAVPRAIDINRGSLAELATLPGIGPTRARAIVLHRVRHGPFRAAADLLAVDGLGPVRVEAVRNFLRTLPGSDAFP